MNAHEQNEATLERAGQVWFNSEREALEFARRVKGSKWDGRLALYGRLLEDTSRFTGGKPVA